MSIDDDSEDEPLLTTKETARRLKFEPQTLVVWRMGDAKLSGAKLPFVKLGRCIRYRPADVRRFIAKNRKEPA